MEAVVQKSIQSPSNVEDEVTSSSQVPVTQCETSTNDNPFVLVTPSPNKAEEKVVSHMDVRSKADSRKAELEELRNKQLARNLRRDLNEGTCRVVVTNILFIALSTLSPCRKPLCICQAAVSRKGATLPLSSSDMADFFLRQNELGKEWRQKQQKTMESLHQYRATSTKPRNKKHTQSSTASAAAYTTMSEMDMFFRQQKQRDEEWKRNKQASLRALHSYRGLVSPSSSSSKAVSPMAATNSFAPVAPASAEDLDNESISSPTSNIHVFHDLQVSLEVLRLEALTCPLPPTPPSSSSPGDLKKRPPNIANDLLELPKIEGMAVAQVADDNVNEPKDGRVDSGKTEHPHPSTEKCGVLNDDAWTDANAQASKSSVEDQHITANTISPTRDIATFVSGDSNFANVSSVEIQDSRDNVMSNSKSPAGTAAAVVDTEIAGKGDDKAISNNFRARVPDSFAVNICLEGRAEVNTFTQDISAATDKNVSNEETVVPEEKPVEDVKEKVSVVTKIGFGEDLCPPSTSRSIGNEASVAKNVQVCELEELLAPSVSEEKKPGTSDDVAVAIEKPGTLVPLKQQELSSSIPQSEELSRKLYSAEEAGVSDVLVTCSRTITAEGSVPEEAGVFTSSHGLREDLEDQPVVDAAAKELDILLSSSHGIHSDEAPERVAAEMTALASTVTLINEKSKIETCDTKDVKSEYHAIGLDSPAKVFEPAENSLRASTKPSAGGLTNGVKRNKARLSQTTSSRSESMHHSPTTQIPANQRERSRGPAMCTAPWSPNLHPSLGGCERCLYFCSKEEVSYYRQHGHHYRIHNTRGGCSPTCVVFPVGLTGQPVRLCRKCFHDTHRDQGNQKKHSH